MVIVMETETGVCETPGVAYDDEVLNAGWLPCPELQLLPVAQSELLGRKPRSAVDPEEFLRSIYRLQE